MGACSLIDLTEDSGFFDAASAPADGGSILHRARWRDHPAGAFSGKMTVSSVGGPDGAVDAFHHTLQKTTDIQEIVR